MTATTSFSMYLICALIHCTACTENTDLDVCANGVNVFTYEYTHNQSGLFVCDDTRASVFGKTDKNNLPLCVQQKSKLRFSVEIIYKVINCNLR